MLPVHNSKRPRTVGGGVEAVDAHMTVKSCNLDSRLMICIRWHEWMMMMIIIIIIIINIIIIIIIVMSNDNGNCGKVLFSVTTKNLFKAPRTCPSRTLNRHRHKRNHACQRYHSFILIETLSVLQVFCRGNGVENCCFVFPR